MMRLVYLIIIAITVIVASCKKESKQPTPNTSGVASTPYAVYYYTRQIGDSCYYNVTQTETTTYTDPSYAPQIFHRTASYYSTVIADSTLPNGTTGKIWNLSSCSIMGGYKQLVYFDSTSTSYIIKPIGTVYYVYPLMVKIPLQQNSTWVNTINNTIDTCKAGLPEYYAIGSTNYNVIDVKRAYFDTINSKNWSFNYKIGDKGILHTYQTEISWYSTFVTVNEIDITLTRTNF